MVILLALAPLCRRWLTILPLGGEAARAVGMALTSSRIVLLLLAACLTAAATLTIGPLSFVGLMAPHIARMMGFRRTIPHMVISGLTGGLLLVFADWCGRMMMFLFQIPAGLLSTFYRRALLYLFAEKAESLTVLDGFNIPGGAIAYWAARWAKAQCASSEIPPAPPCIHTLQLGKYPARGVDGVVDIFMLWATDIKPASNADGARYTPSSSIRWKKRLKRSTSHFTTS